MVSLHMFQPSVVSICTSCCNIIKICRRAHTPTHTHTHTHTLSLNVPFTTYLLNGRYLVHVSVTLPPIPNQLSVYLLSLFLKMWQSFFQTSEFKNRTFFEHKYCFTFRRSGTRSVLMELFMVFLFTPVKYRDITSKNIHLSYSTFFD